MNARMISTQADVARMELEVRLETLHNHNQTLPRIRREFETHEQLMLYVQAQEIDEDFALSLLVQMVLHKRTTLPILVGILRRCFETPQGNPQASQMAADMLVRCAEADLVDWNAMTEQFVVKIDVTPDVRDELDMYQFPLPMIVEPRKLTSNTDSPYLGVRDGSVILRNNHHGDDVCLDHLNRQNRVRFSLNNQVADLIQNRWRNLDKPKVGESKQDFEKRKRAFEKYDRTARRVMAEVTSHGNEFHLTHKYDKRGRTYCQGYHITTQGTAWSKAVVELADKEVIP